MRQKLRIWAVWAGFLLLSGTVYGEDMNWQAALFPETLIQGSYASPVFSTDNVLLLQAEKRRGLYRYNLEDRQLHTVLEPGDEVIDLKTIAGRSELLVRSRVLYGSGGHRIEIIDPESGERDVLATYPSIPDYPRMTVDGGMIYFPVKGNIQRIANPLQKPVETPSSGLYLSIKGDALQLMDSNLKSSFSVVCSDGSRVLSAELNNDGSLCLISSVSGLIEIHDMNSRSRTEIGRGDLPVWSPDGRFILYHLLEDDGHVFTAGELYVYDIEKAEKIQLTKTDHCIEYEASWSPDGRYIAYRDLKNSSIELIDFEK